MKKVLIYTLSLCLGCALLCSCSKDEKPDAPSITLGDAVDGTLRAKAGCALRITPSVENSEGAQYTWTLDGRTVGTEATYTFTGTDAGSFPLSVTVKTAGGESSAKVTVEVQPVDPHYRAASEAAKAACTAVLEYRPAPGQFINDPQAGFSGEKTQEAARAFALKQFGSNTFVSLGGFGGYLVAGFDHSIYNEKGYDFSVIGNSFVGSSEPGIVYVMQDANGNGLADDNWYELKGSESGKAETLRNYEVTYYRPQGDAQSVRWTDNQGGSGEIEYLSEYHDQASYYPAWITDASYTLRGTRLKARTTQDPETGLWTNAEFEWGYADNYSTVDGTGGAGEGGGPRGNRFDIDNAIDANGKAVTLHHIDFVKIQTGVNVQAGWIGEVSTEVLGVKDLNAGK